MRRAVWLVPVLALSAVLSACGSSSGPSPQNTPASPPAATPAPFWHYVADNPSGHARIQYACWQGMILLVEDNDTGASPITAVRATQGQPCFQ